MSGSVLWSQLVGQRVVAADTGQLLGSIRRPLLDRESLVVVVAQLDGGGGGVSVIDWPAVTTIGPDAVIVADASAAREPRGEQERELLSGRRELIGLLVMTEMGDSLGQLEDLELEPSSGRVVRLHVPGEIIELRRVLAHGPDMLILPEREVDAVA